MPTVQHSVRVLHTLARRVNHIRIQVLEVCIQPSVPEKLFRWPNRRVSFVGLKIKLFERERVEHRVEHHREEISEFTGCQNTSFSSCRRCSHARGSKTEREEIGCSNLV